MDTGTKEDESSTGCIWAATFHHATALLHFTMLQPCYISPCYSPATFHHATARSQHACILKPMNHLFLYFSIISFGFSKLRITESTDTASADTGAQLCIKHLIVLLNVNILYVPVCTNPF
jgi:hypothetical protein